MPASDRTIIDHKYLLPATKLCIISKKKKKKVRTN